MDKAKSWVKELQRQANPNIIIALVGNKLDLKDQRQVPVEEASAFAAESGLLFAEASAKTGEFVMEVFTEIAKKIPLDSASLASRSRLDAPPGNRVDLNTNDVQSPSQCQC